MSHLSRAKHALYSAQDRVKIAEAVISLEAILNDLDAIGPMTGSAHLSLAIETLREATLPESPK